MLFYSLSLFRSVQIHSTTENSGSTSYESSFLGHEHVSHAATHSRTQPRVSRKPTPPRS